MKSNALWQISISTSADAEEAVADLAQGLFGLTPAIYHGEETMTTMVSLFSPRKILMASRRLKFLAAGLKNIQRCGLAIGAGTISVKKIKRERWAESWKKHFKPIEISPALLIKPSWSKRRPRKHQAMVVLDPGLSFGTGQHPTTEFCLKQLVTARRPDARQSFLDIGTGSGILAIAAAKLGYRPVDAFDSDPEAVRVARFNAERNGVLGKIHLARRDLKHWPGGSSPQCDVICANLIFELLMSERDRIVGHLKKGGRLVLAGILEAQFASVQKHYQATGLRLNVVETEREWKSGEFAVRS